MRNDYEVSTQEYEHLLTECESKQKMIDLLNEQITSLKAQLKESKVKDTALADIKAMEQITGSYPFEPKPCFMCAKNGCYCSSGGSACKGFTWRGAKEEHEGLAE